MRSKFLAYLGVTLALAAKYSYLMLTVPLPCSGEKVMTASRNKRRRRDFYNQISKNLLSDTENDTDLDSESNLQERAWWNRVHQTFGPQQNACRLKLYWEKGYFWQEENFERKWCLEVNYDRPTLYTCSSTSEQFWILNESDRSIRPYNDQSMCMENIGNKIIVRRCKRGRREQQFEFRSNARMFEIRQGYNCMTNRHHPRAREIMRMERCPIARKSDTSLWECY